jgi:nitrogen fixation/metabolism regulation signal transduction histidine kinase
VKPAHRRLTVAIAASSLVPTLFAAAVLWQSDLSRSVRLGSVAGLIVVWASSVIYIRARSRYHLRTLSNLLAALREGDYSFRAREQSRSDPFSEVIAEVNLLADTLRRQRVDDLEATGLVREVMAEIDVAVFAFDASHRLRLVNHAGEELLGRDRAVIGASASELGLEDCLSGAPARTVQLEIDGSDSRWEMRRGAFRVHGRPNQLLVLSDVSRALHAEELAAWKRMIRVIGHELNNSLAPITSLTGSMERLVRRDPLPDDWRSDVVRGFEVIASRVEALNRFMTDCSRLAKIPEPTLRPVEVAACVRRVTELEKGSPIRVAGGPGVTVQADQDQLEQVLINLVRNAVEAGVETGGTVEIGWVEDGRWLDIAIRDEGSGLADPESLFIPFYTTKPTGSGIGLFLCRHIAEAHGGSVLVRNRNDHPGCEAVLRIPRAGGEPQS